ncbi:MAG: hypothetical protein K8T20_08665 [Planctomycetes bacterium]|nr:hypothetical protein [Planctomycetota bacterium]
MERLHREWKERVGFLMVYISEAHPSDEWQMPSNVEQGVVFEQPRSDSARQDAAGACCSRLKVAMPCVVDSLDNAVDEAYAAWPERLFVVDAAGRIAFATEQGPWGYRPELLERWLVDHSARFT